MLRILTIGDIHFKTTNVKETQDMCDKILLLISKEHVDLIVVMGDTLDRHENIHVVPFTQSIKFIEQLSKLKKTYLLIGNHDRPNNADFLSDYHPFNGLKDKDNLIVVDKVVLDQIQGFNILSVPYVFPGRFMEAINTNKNISNKNINIKDIDIVFAHQEFFATKMGAVLSMIGDKWPLDYPFVISGHIHDYCRPQANIVYVGTPMQHAFGDDPNKTVSIWTVEKGKIPEERRIDLGLIKRIQFELTCPEVNGWLPPDNSLVKLTIKGTSSEIKAIMKLDHLKVLNKKGVKIVYNTLDEIKNGINKEINQVDIKLPYGHRLKTTAEKNELHLYWYNKLFCGMEEKVNNMIIQMDRLQL